MKEPKDWFYVKNFIDNEFKLSNNIIDHDKESKKFESLLDKLTDEEFESLLICTGYIPDLYESDSSQETLYSKLVEVIVCCWAKRMNFSSNYVKQKSSYQDVNILIDKKIIVCDAKSYRLGRSQQAPNVKDFLKLEDMRKWIDRFPKLQRLGGMVVYPSLHEWRGKSDAYQYCSTLNIPTVMLPYTYLSLLLFKKDSFNTNNLSNLWLSYPTMFPKPLLTNMKGGNKDSYWNAINKKLSEIIGIKEEEIEKYISKANALLKTFVQKNISLLKNEIENKKQIISNDVEKLSNEEIKKYLEDYMVDTSTREIKTQIQRIKDFRTLD